MLHMFFCIPYCILEQEQTKKHKKFLKSKHFGKKNLKILQKKGVKKGKI